MRYTSLQNVIWIRNDYYELDKYLERNDVRSLFLVCDSAIAFLSINQYFSNLTQRRGINVVRFDKFQPNPLYESVVEGIELFQENRCDTIIAVGGGSAIDVAKCIKLFNNMSKSVNYLQQKAFPNNIRLLAVPTTAGTGSEATKYAVIYYQGEKKSISDEGCIPETVLMDSSVLKTLPLYQKKATMLDALCHSIESYWSVNSTIESQNYSEKAIELIRQNMAGYMSNDEDSNQNMLMAAHLAGKAINITQTTAGHAMCYKLTSLYGIAHGHAAALCLSVLWPWMIEHINYCIDPRGQIYLKKIFEKLASAFDCENAMDASRKFTSLLENLGMKTPTANKSDYDILHKTVNLDRLKNHPIALDDFTIDFLYHNLLKAGYSYES